MATKANREAAKARRKEKKAKRRALRAVAIEAAPINQRPLRSRLLIVCEGARTEPNYFKGFPVNATVEYTVEGVGKNTLDVVSDAVRFRDAVPIDAPPYTESGRFSIATAFQRNASTPLCRSQHRRTFRSPGPTKHSSCGT